MLQDWATHIDSSTFEEFVHQWMQLNAEVRKTLSHNGAVRSRPGDPCHYRCPVEQVTCFDPSNKIYSVALSILAPQLDFENWNMETRGDICKSLMGYTYLVKIGAVETQDGNERNTKAVADIIDNFSRATYLLGAVTGDDFFCWDRWLKDIAAWRQNAEASEEEQEAVHQILVRLCDQPDPETWPLSL